MARLRSCLGACPAFAAEPEAEPEAEAEAGVEAEGEMEAEAGVEAEAEAEEDEDEDEEEEEVTAPMQGPVVRGRPSSPPSPRRRRTALLSGR